MLAFKIMDDPFVGSLTFCRIYSGKLEAGQALLNSPRDRKERVGRMLLMHANHREDIKEAFAGDIIALAGLREARTGDTLCDPQKPVILEKMEFPDPVIEIAIEPKTKADQEKLGGALSRLAAEDPSFRVSTDEESGQTILKGMGELHLDIKIDILKRTYKVDVAVGQPQVAYRETITRPVDARLHAQEADRRLRPVRRGRVRRRAERSRRRATSSSRRSSAASVPKEYIPGVEKGVESVFTSGPLIGFPVVDVSVTLVDGKYHDVDSSALAFEIAARAGLREALQHGRRRCCSEPIMKVEVVTPEDYLGSVIGDLNSRRGQIVGTDTRGNAQVVNAMVPLANMFQYVGHLRSMSQGRAQYTMQFDHYEQVPRRSRTRFRRSSPDHERAQGQEEGTESPDGQGEIRTDQAALQRRHDRARRPRQDDADGGADQGVDGQGLVEDVRVLRSGRQGLGEPGPPRSDQDPDHRDQPRRVLDAPTGTTRTSTARATPTT